MKSPYSRVLQVAFAFIAGALILLAVNTWKALSEADLALAQVQHTQEVLNQVVTIHESTVIIESLVRGYLISGNKVDLAEQRPVVQGRAAALAQLKALTTDNNTQQARLVNLLALIQERRDLAARSIAARETQGFEAARVISMSAQVNATRARVFDLLTQIKDEELRLLKRHTDAHQTANNKTIDIYKLTLLAMLGLLVLVAVIFRRQNKNRDDQLALELSNHALAVEKTAAEETAQAKDEFLATMSHEIRTPMSSLLGLLELLAHSPLSRDQSEMLDIARDSGRSMVRIIDNILDHAKIQAGKLQIVLEPVSIGHLLTRVNNNYAALASSKGLDLRYMADPRISVGLMANQHRLMQVLGNLVSNAIKFTSEGVVELRADLIDHTAQMETIRLSVKDTGMGMSPEMQARLFQPLKPAGVDTARLYGGTGLGLAISRQLTQMMGGELQVQSAPKEGTTISATFKLALSDVVPVGQLRSSERNALAAVIQRSSAPLVSRAEVGPMSADELSALPNAPWVLAVDDNQTNRILIQRQLSLLGLRVRTATDGDQALELWQNGDYALVLTDINMSALNGYDLARAIRTIELAQGRARTPLLGWTANALADTHARCLAAGMDDVLHKPADLAHLRELLAHWLPSLSVADTGAKAVPNATDSLDRAAEFPALDAKLLQESFGNDRNKLRLLLPTIQKTFSEQIAAMNAALSASDLPSLKTWGHNISGSAGLMGAKALMEVSQRIEAMAEKGDVSALPDLAHQFNTQAQRTSDALSRMG